MESIINLLASNSYIVINKYLLNELGLNETLLLGELASEYNYWKQENGLVDGYFYSTVDNVKNNTTLTRYQQAQALEKLQQLDLVEVEIKGVPAKRYIKIKEESISKIFNNKMLKNLTTRSKKTSELDVKKLDGNNNNKNNNKNNKHIYGEYKNVLLTDNELEKLKNTYSNYKDLITYLDEYIEMKGYKAKSHYLCIKKWVVDAVKEKKRIKTKYTKKRN